MTKLDGQTLDKFDDALDRLTRLRQILTLSDVRDSDIDWMETSIDLLNEIVEKMVSDNA